MSACAELVERGDPDRFLAVMAAPVSVRDPLFTVLAFNLEIARAPWVTQEAMIAEMRLQWWHDIIDEAQSGAPARAHEVAGPLHALLRQGAVPAARLQGMIAARRWDIYRDPFDDWAAFDAHIHATSGGLFAACASAIGAPEQGLDPGLEAIAYASGVAQWLCAVPALEAAGRMPLPDGRPQAVQDLAQRALAGMPRARPARALRPVARMGWLAAPLLRQVIRRPSAVADGTLQIPEGRKRLRLMAQLITGH